MKKPAIAVDLPASTGVNRCTAAAPLRSITFNSSLLEDAACRIVSLRSARAPGLVMPASPPGWRYPDRAVIEPATSTLEPEVSIDLSRMLSNRGRVSGFRIVEAREAHRLPHLDVAAFRRVFTLLKQAAGLQVRIFQYFVDFIGMNGGHMSFFQEPSHSSVVFSGKIASATSYICVIFLRRVALSIKRSS